MNCARSYQRRAKSAPVGDEWRFYVCFSLFRAAAILQGVYKRSRQGNASAKDAVRVCVRLCV